MLESIVIFLLFYVILVHIIWCEYETMVGGKKKLLYIYIFIYLFICLSLCVFNVHSNHINRFQ
jgi:hypothetical protein